MSKRFKDGDLVLVEWIDPNGPTVPWTRVSKMVDASMPSKIISVGFVYRTRHGITVIPHHYGYQEDDCEGFGEINLPAGTVVAIHHLKMPRLRK